jgi:hypothetical protein
MMAHRGSRTPKNGPTFAPAVATRTMIVTKFTEGPLIAE